MTAQGSGRESRYRPWEWGVIVFGLALLVGSSTLYVSGVSLRRYLLGWDDGEGSEEVGKLATKAGNVRRQLGMETEFKSIESSATLYNYDTIMTSSEGGATLQIDDGSKIELGPDTMVRLAFNMRLGAPSSTTVEVVTGEVTGVSGSRNMTLRSRKQSVPVSGQKSLRVGRPPKPKPSPSPTPTPSPSPTVVTVKLVEPKIGTLLRIDKLTEAPSREVALRWEVSPPEAELVVVLRGPGPKGGEILRKAVAAQGGRAAASAELKAPGAYAWELLAPDGSALELKAPLKATFKLHSEIVAIETLPPLVGGMKARTNAYQGEVLSKFDVTLRWKELEGAKSYLIRVTDKPDSKKVLLERKVSKAEYLFNKDKIFSGRVYYKILAKRAAGFYAVSEPELFAFNFLPPALVIPGNKAVISRAALASSDNSVLMTWQKTNFTVGYEIEIAADSQFKKTLLKKNVKENFFVLKSAPTGKWWWRVRSFSKEIASAFSMPYELTINP